MATTNNLPTDIDVEEVLNNMLLEAADGFALCELLEAEQTTESGIIMTQYENYGYKRGIVLKAGRLNSGFATRDGADDISYKTGDLIYWAARETFGMYDPGLDRNVAVVGYSNIMAFIPYKAWSKVSGKTATRA